TSRAPARRSRLRARRSSRAAGTEPYSKSIPSGKATTKNRRTTKTKEDYEGREYKEPRNTRKKAINQKTIQRGMALGLGVTSYGVNGYDSLFFNKDQQMYVYKI